MSRYYKRYCIICGKHRKFIKWAKSIVAGWTCLKCGHDNTMTSKEMML